MVKNRTLGVSSIERNYVSALIEDTVWQIQASEDGQEERQERGQRHGLGAGTAARGSVIVSVQAQMHG